MPEKLGPSHDAQEEALQRLAEVFPQAITDGKVDLECLKQALGEHVETGRERYGLTWPGKAEAIKAAQRPSLGTLRPKIGEGINEASTGNLIIEGDNLEVLKLLQKAYLGKIKMIYIDPPYNTGNDFVYEDNFADPLAGYLEQTGQTADGKRLSTNTETAGRYHSNWLSMMYPRLTLARNLLREDGVIFISIDDNEVANLRKICDEVFGEENVLANFAWVSNLKGRQIVSGGPAGTYEYVICCARNAELIDQFRGSAAQFRSMMPSVYKGEGYEVLKDELGDFVVKNELYNTNSKFNEKTARTMVFKIYHNFQTGDTKTAAIDDEKSFTGYTLLMPHANAKPNVEYHAWRWSRDKIERDYKELHFVKTDGGARVYSKIRDIDGMAMKDLIIGPSTTTGQASLEKLGLEDVFDTPKPVELVSLFAASATDPSALILDFFAGSGTTAQAVLEMNEEDGGNRKFILVQLPEVVDEDSAAAKAGFRNIAEITKERVRRVIKKLDGGTKDGLGLDGKKNLDRGFKVYALDRSNFVPWDATAATDAASLEKQLELTVDNVLHDRSDADLLAEILLKTGFPLDTAITKVTIAGTTVYQVADPGFLVCLAETVTAPLIKAIAAAKPHRVVILDAAFGGNDALKTNAVQAFKDQGVEMFRTA